MIYLAIFAFSTLALYLASHCKGTAYYIFVAVGIALPCLLAGFRDAHVGTDLSVYGLEMYELALDNSFQDYMQRVRYANVPAFSLIVWVSANLFHSTWLYLAILMFLVVFPVFLALQRNDRRTAWVGMLAFYLFFFPFALNGMKQSIAVSLVLFVSRFAIEKRPVPYCCGVILATAFHLTAIVALLFYPVIRALSKGGGLRHFFGKNYLAGTIVLMLIIYAVILSIGEPLIILLASFRAAYSYQVKHIGLGDFSYTAAVLFLLILIVNRMTPLARSGMAHIGSATDIYLILALGGCICFELDLLAESLSRFAYYGFIFILPWLQNKASSAERGRKIYLALVPCSFLAVFVYSAILQGHHGIYPYSSAILGI